MPPAASMAMMFTTNCTKPEPDIATSYDGEKTKIAKEAINKSRSTIIKSHD
jgi:hypothetical protein